MKYKNANEILPDELVLELQKYAAGTNIYIPKLKENHIKWGVVSGSREHVVERNKRIKLQFEDGEEVHKLAGEHHLSIESIRKIVYKK